jgi:hypothetical protein
MRQKYRIEWEILDASGHQVYVMRILPSKNF